MSETTSETAKGIVNERREQINPAIPESQPPVIGQNQGVAAPETDHRSFLARLFRIKKPTPVEPQVIISSNFPETPTAINTSGEAIHGIGDYVSENELSELEQGTKTSAPAVEPSGSAPYRHKDGEFGLKVHSDKVPDPISTNIVSSPEYNPNTAPDNVSPINEYVAGQVPPPQDINSGNKS